MNPYFTDDIGNVSTSRFRPGRKEANLELKPRYPVFGGWKYSFRVGWDANLSTYLRKLSSGDSYVLKVPFLEGPRQQEGIEYSRVTLRVILPEGATNVKYSTSVPTVDNSISLHHTFLDTVGRTTLTLTSINLVDDFRDRDLIVTYDYPWTAGLRKPIVITLGVFALFTTVWIVGRQLQKMTSLLTRRSPPKLNQAARLNRTDDGVSQQQEARQVQTKGHGHWKAAAGRKGVS